MKRFWLAWRRHFGTAIGFVSLLLTVVFFWYQEFGKVGEVTLSVLHQGSIVTIQREVPDLEVRFRGATLQGNDKSLRFYNIEIRNTGTLHIVKAAFDEPPWEVHFKGGQILQVTQVVNKVDALTNIDPRIVDGNKFRFSPANVDTGDWVRIDFLALVDSEREPAFDMVGRISGTNFNVRPFKAVESGPFDGALPTQITRLAGYGLIALVLTTVVGLVFGGWSVLSRTWAVNRRGVERRRLERLPSSIDLGLQRGIVELFGAWDWDGIDVLKRFLGDPTFRKRCLGMAADFMALKEALPRVEEGRLRHTVFSELGAGASDMDKAAARMASDIIVDNKGVEDADSIRGAFEFIDKMREAKARNFTKPVKSTVFS